MGIIAMTLEVEAAGSEEVAVLAGGCFWCIEAVFEELKGVKKAVSGYAGGKTSNPDYKSVCRGDTGHAEVLEITFDPKVLPYTTLLDVFFATHDPTTPNRQGNDVGTQYRSAIFYTSPAQKAAAEASIKAHQSQFSSPIVTEITALPRFYPAEEYHQTYFKNNPNQPYCSALIGPKVKKFKEKYAKLLK